jgi:hypothetical protein
MTFMSETILISNAISILGHKPIQTLDNADAMTNAAIQAYALLLPAVLSSNNWRFACAIQPLIQLPELPPPPWGAVWLLPSGFLKLIRLYPNIYEFDIYNGNRIYTIINQNFAGQNPPPPPIPPGPFPYYNRTQLFSIEYIYQPDASQFPSHFARYFPYEIAAYLALNNAQRPDYAAYMDKKREYEFAMAAAIEAQNRPQFSQVLFPVLEQRNIGGFIGNSTGAG